MSDIENHYVNKKEFHDELVEYNRTKIISEKLHLMFWTLAKNIAKKSRFRGYSYKQDMIQEAYIRCVTYVGSYDCVNRTNPYAYYTQVIHNRMQDFIWDEQDAHTVRWKALKHQVQNKAHDDDYSELNLSPMIKEKVDSCEYSLKRRDKSLKKEVENDG